MGTDDGFPPSVILDGPVFSDELIVSPQQFRQSHDIDSLRLVPAKSASSGVNSVYFRPQDRQWALVRLAIRYRWVLEIQLNRGLSGEQQLLNQGFTTDDVDFLFAIFPHPPHEYNPIVYDMLWLVATYDEYLQLARALTDVESFTPRELVERTPGIELEDAGFLTRFLRHHMISPVESDLHRNAPHSGKGRSTSQLDLDKTYLITEGGREALHGIINEYERIFILGEFEELFLTPDRDPVEHLREFEGHDHTADTTVSLEDIQEEGILGDIAESFASLEVEDEQPWENIEPESDTEVSIQSEPHRPDGYSYSSEISDSDSVEDSSQVSRHSEIESSDDRDTLSCSSQYDGPGDVSLDETAEFGEFTRDEVLEATIIAARQIQSESVVRTNRLKQTVRESVPSGDHSEGQIWDYVAPALRSIGGIIESSGGRLWLSVPPTNDPPR